MVKGWRTPHIQNVKNFLERVEVSNGCWLWLGGREGPNGYGFFRWGQDRIAYKAHRLMWALVHGDFDERLDVCHHCDNPPCVRPDHLFLGTASDNMKDMYSKGRCDNRGLNNPRARITVDDARRILLLHKEGKSQAEIAPLCNISVSIISKIVRGKHWTSNQLTEESV